MGAGRSRGGKAVVARPLESSWWAVVFAEGRCAGKRARGLLPSFLRQFPFTAACVRVCVPCSGEKEDSPEVKLLKAELAEAEAAAESASTRAEELDQQIKALQVEMAAMPPVTEVVDVQSIVAAEAKAAAAEAELEALR